MGRQSQPRRRCVLAENLWSLRGEELPPDPCSFHRDLGVIRKSGPGTKFEGQILPSDGNIQDVSALDEAC